MNLSTLVGNLQSKWMEIKKMVPGISMDLLHVIESNITSLSLYSKLIEDNYVDAVRLGEQNEENKQPSAERVFNLISRLTVLGTHCSSFYLYIRSLSDNLYRLHLEISEPGSKWGAFTSMNKGLKNSKLVSKLSDYEDYKEWFFRMRELRNCMKTGGYASGGGYDPKKKEIILSLIVVEKEGKRARSYERKLKMSELEEAIIKSTNCLVDICS